ncbi:adenylyl-sulfate kinase [Ferrovibrio sp.]|uniref:adenylyl-sulfate kinase n=1 Tax=Ferrovibrio sp. TaxID=1917215 RepID=UPI003518926A
MVLWLTGLSGAGKSTIAQAVHALAKPRMPGLVLIDGDVIRALFGAGLGYKEADRYQQIGRIQRLAGMLSGQDIRVIVAALYCHPDLMAWNRANLPGYFEVYVDAPLNLVRQRDVKGLYARALAGETSDVVGVDIPWHAPQAPDLIIDTANETPAQSARRLMQAVPWLAELVSTGGRNDG